MRVAEPDTAPTVALAYAPGGGGNPLGVLTFGEAAVLAVRLLGLYYALNALILFSTMSTVFYSLWSNAVSLPNEALLQFTYPLA